MDGVVIDSQPIADVLLAETAAYFGVQLSGEQLQQLLGWVMMKPSLLLTPLASW